MISILKKGEASARIQPSRYVLDAVADASAEAFRARTFSTLPPALQGISRNRPPQNSQQTDNLVRRKINPPDQTGVDRPKRLPHVREHLVGGFARCGQRRRRRDFLSRNGHALKLRCRTRNANGAVFREKITEPSRSPGSMGHAW